MKSEHTKKLKIFPYKCGICKCKDFYRKENTGKLSLGLGIFYYSIMGYIAYLVGSVYGLSLPKNQPELYMLILMIIGISTMFFIGATFINDYFKIKQIKIGVVQ